MTGPLQYQEPPEEQALMNIQLTEVQHGSDRAHLPDLAPGTYNVQIRDAVNPTCILVLNRSLGSDTDLRSECHCDKDRYQLFRRQ